MSIGCTATGQCDQMGFGASIETSRQLASMYRVIADRKGVAFFDAGSAAQVSPLDGVHLDADGHASLGRAMATAALEVLDG